MCWGRRLWTPWRWRRCVCLWEHVKEKRGTNKEKKEHDDMETMTSQQSLGKYGLTGVQKMPVAIGVRPA